MPCHGNYRKVQKKKIKKSKFKFLKYKNKLDETLRKWDIMVVLVQNMEEIHLDIGILIGDTNAIHNCILLQITWHCSK